MAVSAAFRAFVVELFETFGPVTVRPMFGAAGIYADDVMFGLVAEERIFLKTDARSRTAYEDEGMKPFTFEKARSGEPITTSYFALPERLYDDSDELAEWARRACEAAASTTTEKRKQHGRARAGTRQPLRRRKRF